MAEIRWTEEAAMWLECIYNYIAEDSPETASKVVKGIYSKVQTLQVFPETGYRYSKEADGEVRILLFGHYRIAYLIKTDCVEILGVFHGAMEIDNYINLYGLPRE